MSSTYSSSLRIELIGTGDQAGVWGATTDNNLGYILDTAIAGYQTVSVTAASQALTYLSGAVSSAALNQSVYAMLRFTTTTGAAFSVYAPPVSKQYVIWNNSGYAMTIYNSTVIGNTTAAGTGITVANGDKVIVWSDATNFYDIKSNNITGTVAIANGGTGQTTQQAALNALAGTQTNNRVLRSNGTNTTLSQVALATDVTGILPEANGGTGSSAGTQMFKNRIINGAMVIDARNAGASVTPTNDQYLTDRFTYVGTQTSKFTAQQNAGSLSAANRPAGFINYLGFTSSSAYSVLAADVFAVRQKIEGLNVADLNWGTASAATVTLSFWVRSSLTGTFAGSLLNADNSRSYPFTFTISSANTWEQKTITVAGDTSGTWLTTNGIGLQVAFSLGTGTTGSGTANAWASAAYFSATGATSVVGTNGATFYITGVQLEKGSTATSFDYRPYGTELQLCQRYYYRTTSPASGIYIVNSALSVAATLAYGTNVFPVPLRDRPTALEQDGTAANYFVVRGGAVGQTVCSAVPAFVQGSVNQAITSFTVASGLTNGSAAQAYGNTSTTYLGWSAEL